MFVKLDLPPGIYRNGTEYQSSGRYYEANWIRFYEGQIRPVGGWRQRSQQVLEGKGREIVSWRDNQGQLWAGIGTDSNLYAMTRSGVVHDITPAGYTVGNRNARNGGGYGTGVYGAGVYGLPIASIQAVIPATVWTLDNWGENLVGLSSSEGIIYEWPPAPAAPAGPIAGAPPARSMIVTGERIMMALGASGDPRRIEWSDQEDNTQWVPQATNQAGDFTLQTSGELLSGVKIPGGVLLFTETDVWTATYLGPPFVYGFESVSDGSGAISQNAVTAIDGRVLWMGPQGFWSFSGFASPLQCDVSDHVFMNINRDQISKVSSFHNSAFGEVWWFYPSNNSTENDSYVVYSYREGHWSIGKTDRLSATDMSPFQFPLMVSDDGYVYEHEVGFNHHEEDVYLEGGPVEIAQGDQVAYAHQYIPDQSALGDVTINFATRFTPLGKEEIYGPYDASQYTDIRISGRQLKIRYNALDNGDWRIGSNRVDVRVGGRR